MRLTDVEAEGDNGRTILVAEIAALLHNIGKLDPNFLAQSARDVDKKAAVAQVKGRGLEITPYQFRRFAAPPPELFRPELQEVMQRFQGKTSAKEARREALLELDVWTKQERDVLRTEDASNRDPDPKAQSFLLRELQAADLVLSFRSGNGPLYSCLTDDRAAAAAEIQRLKTEVARLDVDVRAAEPETKAAIGARRNEAKEQLRRAPGRIKRLSKREAAAQKELENEFRKLRLEVAGESWPIADLLTLFWDNFFYRPPLPGSTGADKGDDYRRRYALERWLAPGQGSGLPMLLILSHGEVSGTEKGRAAGGRELEKRPQLWSELRSTTAFGHLREELDIWSFHTARHELLRAGLDAFDEPAKLRSTLVAKARQVLETGLGDTQWPINEIDLWDYASSIAALFKSGVAGAILTGVIPPVGEVRWRLLHVSFDGLAFWGQAHHVTDLLGRRQVLEDGLNKVRDTLEFEYPLGNEIYRDENGSIFVVPHVPDLLELPDGDDQTLRTVLRKAFDSEGLAGEFMPEIQVTEARRGKKLSLADVLAARPKCNAPDSKVAESWWAPEQRPANAEICTVCGQRPVGYPAKGSSHQKELGLQDGADQKKAKERNVCRVCLQRRGRRARDWAWNIKGDQEEAGPFDRTIWIDEVADDNGRFALIVGRFILDGWLDGSLIPTISKPVSLARIRRCWETTRRFWEQVESKEIPERLSRRVRLGLRPTNLPEIRNPHPEKGLGPWHAYEAEIAGRRLGLCWDPEDAEGPNDGTHDLLWTTDNLTYLGRQLNFPPKALQNEERLIEEWSKRLKSLSELSLYEPGGYRGQDTRANVDAEHSRVEREHSFAPYIPLMTEPSTFMALIPAVEALAVAEAIRDKYDGEMARVRDRLPLHLGLVFAPRRTPLAAVLEAGRAMLNMPHNWEEWEAKAEDRSVTFKRGERSFRSCYPAKMADGTTDDAWYANLLKTDPGPSSGELAPPPIESLPVEDAAGKVYIRPSRFDFQFLDTTGRRFEIAYRDGQALREYRTYRPSRPTRPFLLDDLKHMEAVWRRFGQLSRSQIHQIIGAIEATREMWQAGPVWSKESNPVFWQFASDTLARANWPKADSRGRDLRWRVCPQPERDKLIAAAASGELTDWTELHLQILKQKGKE